MDDGWAHVESGRSEREPHVPSRVPREQQRRAQLAATKEAQDYEARRPSYLKRTKRLPPHHSAEAAASNQENTCPRMGVVESPNTGRRLALFQETSEESFEQSLLAGGYPLYGRTPAYVEPSTPSHDGKPTSMLGASSPLVSQTFS